MYIGTATMENSLKVLLKTKHRVTTGSSNPSLGIYPKETIIWKDACIPTLIAAQFTVAQTVKNSPAMQETQVQSLSQEDPLEKEMATISSILAWEIPRTEEPGGSPGVCKRVGHNLVTKQQHNDKHCSKLALVPFLTQCWLSSPGQWGFCLEQPKALYSDHSVNYRHESNLAHGIM